MSNVGLVRSIYERWDAGDFSDVSWAAPDIEFSAEGAVDMPPVIRGLRSMSEAWRDYLSAWQDFRTNGEDYIDLGGRVFVVTRFSGRARASGVGVDTFRGGCLFTLRDGKVVALRLYNHLDLAYEELGIPTDR